MSMTIGNGAGPRGKFKGGDKMRKIVAYGMKSRIPMSLSNYMAGCREGNEKARQIFIDVINSQPMSWFKICRALNKHKMTTDIFSPHRVVPGGFEIIATDSWGNKDVIRITEEE